MSLKYNKTSQSFGKNYLDPASFNENGNILFQNEIGYPNATRLDDFLDDDSFLQNLKVRFFNKKIYTCIESTVIAINPFESLPLYSAEVIAAYEHHNIQTLPPHIYALCEFVLHCLKERNMDQSIICTGVSGSGKTESFKLALNYFINGSSERSELNQIKTRFNSIPIILEAFGNANTESNSNSTRLFYTLEIDFDFLGDPLGGQICDYFIEKTRVARHEIYGYNFHIFYQLIGGAGTNLLKFLKLKRDIESYQLLKDKTPEQYTSNGQNCFNEFQKTKTTLQVLGFTANEIIECLQILAFILKLGNVQFLRKANMDSTEGCSIFNDYEIYEICDIFNLNSSIFLKSFTHKLVKNEQEVFITDLSANSATKIRNCICKALYFRLFTWIIEKINESIKTKPSLNLTRNNLSLHDFFGFENYSINFFEQMLINYLQEKIVQIFTDRNFRQKQEEYLREDIGWKKLELSTNDPICNFVDRPQTGILAVLNEASSKSIFFREEIFIKEINEHCGDDLHYIQINNPVILDNNGNGYFLHSLPYRRRLSAGDVSQSVPQLCFGIRHFNENAVYSINGFIEKNAEHLNRNWSQFLFNSGHTMLQKLFPEGNTLKKNIRKPITLANQFSIAIESMLAKLQNKEIHYIMCIKPNRLKIPNIFDDEFVYKQLASLFIIEHGEFLRHGYVYSERYETFFQRYRILTPQTWPFWTGSIVNGVFTCLNLVLNSHLNDFNFGKTKILIKHLKTFVELEELRIVKLDEIAIIIQKNLRKWLQIKKFHRLIYSQIKISRSFRNWKRRCYLIWLYRHLPSPSPISHDWPPSPKSMKQTSELLRRLYHKWRCNKYRRCFDQINRNRMREKVTAMMLFKNRKASYRSSVAHPFRGDYIRLRQNVKWKRLLPTLGDVYVVFADLVSKITKRCGKEQFIQKVVAITTTSFIVLDGKTMQINHNVKLNNIFKISSSPYMDNILVIHIHTENQQQPQTPAQQQHSQHHRPPPPHHHQHHHHHPQRQHQLTTIDRKAFIFESVHLIELITKLFLVIQNNNGKGPLLEISPEFQMYTGKETLVLVFKNRNQQQSTTPIKINRKQNRMEFSN